MLPQLEDMLPQLEEMLPLLEEMLPPGYAQVALTHMERDVEPF